MWPLQLLDPYRGGGTGGHNINRAAERKLEGTTTGDGYALVGCGILAKAEEDDLGGVQILDDQLGTVCIGRDQIIP